MKENEPIPERHFVVWISAKGLEHYYKLIDEELKKMYSCLHDQCTACHGTGIRADMSACIHSISCKCMKCTPVDYFEHKKPDDDTGTN